MRARWSRAAPFVGLLVIVGAVSPPAEEAADRSLSGHMVQHLVLLLAPALLAADRPMARIAGMVSDSGAARLRLTRSPASAGVGSVAIAVGVVHAVAVSAWHIPAAYDAAASTTPLHVIEHLTFVAVGWTLWVALRAAIPADPAAAVASLFIVAAQGAALGAILTFAPHAVYDTPAADPLADQQLAGLLMWVPGGAPYAALAALIVVRALSARPPAPSLAVVRKG